MQEVAGIAGIVQSVDLKMRQEESGVTTGDNPQWL